MDADVRPVLQVPDCLLGGARVARTKVAHHVGAVRSEGAAD
jgi:hypothetical protein